MSTRPTPAQEEIADYVTGWREGHIAGQVMAAYDHRPMTTGENHFFAHLDRAGFFASQAPLVEVATGASPHVGWHLCTRLAQRDVYFVDWHAQALAIHKKLYRHLTHSAHDGETCALREYWLLGDAQREPYLLRDKAVIVHGILPRLRDGDDVLLPDTLERMTKTLAGLLAARPDRLALYLFNGDQSTCIDHAARVLPALDHLGVDYRWYGDVASANFQPVPGGSLILLTP